MFFGGVGTVGCRFAGINEGVGHYPPPLVHLKNYGTVTLWLVNMAVIDGICLHCVYMAMKTKMGLKACARKPAYTLALLVAHP